MTIELANKYRPIEVYCLKGERKIKVYPPNPVSPNSEKFHAKVTDGCEGCPFNQNPQVVNNEALKICNDINSGKEEKTPEELSEELKYPEQVGEYCLREGNVIYQNNLSFDPFTEIIRIILQAVPTNLFGSPRRLS